MSGSLRQRLLELAALFLRLGTTAFGGPAAHIAMMHDEVVHRRKWFSEQELLDLIGATNLIPGPNSTELAIHIGHRRAGFAGLIVAGVCFIIPAMLIVTAIAVAYVKWRELPQFDGILYGVKPVIIAVVFQALWRLGRSAVKSWMLAVVGACAVAALFLQVNELVVLFGCGALMMVARGPCGNGKTMPAGLVVTNHAGVVGAGSIAAAVAAKPFALQTLFWFFLKTGSVLFGSGYVLLAFLRADLVERWHWLTEAQLLDAIAVGQVTPGPVFTTATFIGYLLGGYAGAIVATVGIFLPAFFFVAISGPFVPRLRESRVAGAFLDGVNVASLALMVAVTVQLTSAAIVDAVTVILAAVSAILLIHLKVNSAWLVAFGAVIGLLLR